MEMNDSDNFNFLYIIDSAAVMQGIIRSYQLSSRLKERSICAKILTFQLRKNALFKSIILDNVPESYEAYKHLFFQIKNKYIW